MPLKVSLYVFKPCAFNYVYKGCSVLSESFGKDLRLLNANNFKAVFDDAPFRASHQHLLILARANPTLNAPVLSSDAMRPRIGLVIAKKNIPLAVQRNRIKRIARETFRLQQDKLLGVDAVVLARRNLDSLDNAELQSLFNKQWEKVVKKAKKAQQTAAP